MIHAEQVQNALRADNDRLRKILKEMVEAHSMANVGINASRRRLDAIKQARLELSRIGRYLGSTILQSQSQTPRTE